MRYGWSWTNVVRVSERKLLIFLAIGVLVLGVLFAYVLPAWEEAADPVPSEPAPGSVSFD